jgi:hypothetical protein
MRMSCLSWVSSAQLESSSERLELGVERTWPVRGCQDRS